MGNLRPFIRISGKFLVPPGGMIQIRGYLLTKPLGKIICPHYHKLGLIFLVIYKFKLADNIYLKSYSLKEISADSDMIPFFPLLVKGQGRGYYRCAFVGLEFLKRLIGHLHVCSDIEIMFRVNRHPSEPIFRILTITAADPVSISNIFDAIHLCDSVFIRFGQKLHQ